MRYDETVLHRIFAISLRPKPSDRIPMLKSNAYANEVIGCLWRGFFYLIGAVIVLWFGFRFIEHKYGPLP